MNKPEPTGEVVSNVMWHYRGINVNTWLRGEPDEDAQRLGHTFDAVQRFLNAIPADAREDVLKEQQRGGGGYGGGRQGGRETRFEPIDGYQCDKCGGPVGRKPQQGSMRSAAVVCLGACKDPDKDGTPKYVHTVGWCNDDGTPKAGVPKSGQQPTGSHMADEAQKQGATVQKEKTVGDLLTWAKNEHGLSKDQVLEIAGVKGAADIKDIREATNAVITYVSGNRQMAGLK